MISFVRSETQRRSAPKVRESKEKHFFGSSLTHYEQKSSEFLKHDSPNGTSSSKVFPTTGTLLLLVNPIITSNTE